MSEVCAACECAVDVVDEAARAEAHGFQLHFPFVMYCPENQPGHNSIFRSLYDTPWDQDPCEVFFCSDTCEQAYCSSGSFEYNWCDSCDRQVCEQNPANGWQLQFREHPDLGYVCLRCYEDAVLQYGQPRSDYEGDTIRGGMFFNHGNPEPKAAGFDEVEDFQRYFVRDRDDCRRYNRAALERIDHGYAVLTGFETLAIGGLEGYITMMERKA